MIYALSTAIGGTDQENSFGSVSRMALINLDKIASVTSADKAKVDALTLVATNKFHEVKFQHDTASMSDEYTVGGTDQYWNHTVNFTLKGHDVATIVAGRALCLGQNYVALIKRPSGQWFLVGYSNGMNTTAYTANAVAEANGRTFTLVGKNLTSALLVDEAIALAMIDAA